MKNLAHLKFYLCGQVEQDKDAAKWRELVAHRLCSVLDDIIILDPLIKPKWFNCPDNIAYGYKKEVQDYLLNNADLTDNVMNSISANRQVRSICKQLANKCDVLIARLTNTFTWGSIDEIEIAINRNIPIFMVLPDNIVSIYGIPFTCNHLLARFYLHKSIDSLVSTLYHINNDDELFKKDPEKWLSITWNSISK